MGHPHRPERGAQKGRVGRNSKSTRVPANAMELGFSKEAGMPLSLKILLSVPAISPVFFREIPRAVLPKYNLAPRLPRESGLKSPAAKLPDDFSRTNSFSFCHIPLCIHFTEASDKRTTAASAAHKGTHVFPLERCKSGGAIGDRSRDGREASAGRNRGAPKDGRLHESYDDLADKRSRTPVLGQITQSFPVWP